MNFKEITEKIKNDKKLLFVIIAGISGIFLLIISNFSSSDNIDSNKVISENKKSEELNISDLEEKIEEKLCGIISSVNGAGKAEVAVSISSTGEYVFAENKKSGTDSDSSSLDTEVVIYDNSDSENGLVISIKSPDVLGVAVICEGGGSSVVRAEITQLITCLFGIGSDRVYVGTKS